MRYLPIGPRRPCDYHRVQTHFLPRLHRESDSRQSTMPDRPICAKHSGVKRDGAAREIGELVRPGIHVPVVKLTGRMLDELNVRCTAEGCGKVMQRGLLLSHSRTCQQAVITCPDDECGLSVSFADDMAVSTAIMTGIRLTRRWLRIVCRTIVHTNASSARCLAQSAMCC